MHDDTRTKSVLNLATPQIVLPLAPHARQLRLDAQILLTFERPFGAYVPLQQSHIAHISSMLCDRAPAVMLMPAIRVHPATRVYPATRVQNTLRKPEQNLRIVLCEGEVDRLGVLVSHLRRDISTRPLLPFLTSSSVLAA